MTTIDEFNKITQSMYEKGYVLVSLHDMATFHEDGTVIEGRSCCRQTKSRLSCLRMM